MAPTPTKVDASDPAVRRLVYNMYRGMLGGYNDQANTIVDALPAERVREDQGVYKQLESIIRSQQAGDSFSPDVSDGGNGPPPPPPFAVPPPPPPPGPGGGIPSLRINSEIEGRGRSPRPTAPGEPPAAIQNAMMTKDKKPFTYTPGGLDLSQIRSPRIQRRINRNMADEGVGPLPAQQDHAPLPPAAQAAMQPNMPVQVLPPPPPPPPPSGGPSPSYAASSPAKFSAVPPPSYAPPLGGAQAAVSTQAVQQTAANLRPTTIPSVRREPQPEPGSLYIAPFSPAPSPALATSGPRSQLGSLYIPPVADAVDAASASPPPPPPQRHFSPLSPQTPQANLNKAPTPWMSSLQQQQQQACAPAPPAAVTQGGARIIPIQIEGRESPQPSNPHAPYSPHASFSPQTPNSPQTPQTPQTPQEAHLSQWQREQKIRQQQRQQQLQQHQFQQPQSVPWRNAQQVQPSPPPAQPGERTIPIRLESSNGTAFPASPPASAAQRQPFSPVRQTGPTTPQQQYNSGSEWGAAQGPGQGAGPPIQSQSFRVLQKITDDSNGAIPHQQPGRMNEMNAAQLRKLQLNDDDRALMNKFKAQVDDEVYLHQEADPRYRGAAIPSRAFRMLQNMTGEDDESFSMPAPSRISPAVRAAQQAVQEGAASQAYVPPSEQTVQEPRKYTGGAIPSRSFRMLQAMTGSENCDPADTSDL